MPTVGAYLSIITLNINGLNFSIKSDQMVNKQDPMICCIQQTHFTSKGTPRLQMER